MKRNLIAILIFSLHQAVFSNQLDFVGVSEKNKSYNLEFSLEKTALIIAQSSNSPYSITLEFKETYLKENFDLKLWQNYPIKNIESSTSENNSIIEIFFHKPVAWQKPQQIKTEDGIKVLLSLDHEKEIKKMTREAIVIIDAGHGGRDPGAIAKSHNVIEKDITLLIANELFRTLEDTDGYKPVLVREDDSFIYLDQRYQKARQNSGDIFVSIHADAFSLPSVKGAAVYIWSDEASSNSAKSLSSKKVSSVRVDEFDFDEDLARSKYPEIYEKKKGKSLQLGKKILDQLKRDPYTHLHKKRVEYADFRVLKSLDVPSVLIESGFISNSEDAERLKGKPGRRMIARSLFLGINNYFKENLEDDFFIYDAEGYLTYTVQRGDVLSEIAIRFGVPVMDIINTNLIRDEAIFPGQRIKIKI
ncbi:N-acetylmuramoyl-L-alanine amidase [Pseudomonadota bacterium]|nr:N-acetylmuramoyl-L-alanine amidase [Pseudomonadota bacterium]